jgi:hypothetical protein
MVACTFEQPFLCLSLVSIAWPTLGVSCATSRLATRYEYLHSEHHCRYASHLAQVHASKKTRIQSSHVIYHILCDVLAQVGAFVRCHGHFEAMIDTSTPVLPLKGGCINSKNNLDEALVQLRSHVSQQVGRLQQSGSIAELMALQCIKAEDSRIPVQHPSKISLFSAPFAKIGRPEDITPGWEECASPRDVVTDACTLASDFNIDSHDCRRSPNVECIGSGYEIHDADAFILVCS